MKKIPVRFFQDGIEVVYEKQIVLDRDNSFSLQNEGATIPVLTLAIDKKGCLMVNTNSIKYILEKTKTEGGEA